MWHTNTGCHEHADYEYLKARVIELEERERQRSEQHHRELANLVGAARGRRQEEERQASSWDEAFEKQRVLLRRELAKSEAMLASDDAECRDWFTEDAALLRTDLAQIDQAEKIYREEMAAVEEKAARMFEEARAIIARRLEGEILVVYLAAWAVPALIQHLVNDDDPSAWLDW